LNKRKRGGNNDQGRKEKKYEVKHAKARLRRIEE